MGNTVYSGKNRMHQEKGKQYARQVVVIKGKDLNNSKENTRQLLFYKGNKQEAEQHSQEKSSQLKSVTIE